MKKTVMRMSLGTAAAGALICNTVPAQTTDVPWRWQVCVGIASDSDRLLCYDRLAGEPLAPARTGATPGNGSGGAGMASTSQHVANADAGRDAASGASYLADHWELGQANKRGVFNFRPHHKNYIVATYNPSPNQAPYRPFRALTPESDGLSHSELAFQLGFKLKLLENVADQPLDLWFGYTQRSFWQAGNQAASSPFRETDYQPEVMAVLPFNLNVLGLKLRMLNVGVAHQSNGQASSLSRSWNRAYLQAGFERGNFNLLARIWKRFNEAESDDNNPNIIDYMGRGDLVGTYRWNGHEFSMLTRYNFHTDKGAAQLSWAFPLVSNLKGYVQFFSGYGYTLIDYDASQRVLSVGVQVNY